jgi:hypothetical protein
MAKKKSTYKSNPCCLKALLKYAAFQGYSADKNQDLLDSFVIAFLQMQERGEGWLKLQLGIQTERTDEVLLLIRCLLVAQTRDDLNLQAAHDESDILNGSILQILENYLLPIDGKFDRFATDLAKQDFMMAFEDPSQLVRVYKEHKHTLRQRWVANTTKQLMPVEKKMMRLQACLLLGSPETLSDENLCLLLQATWLEVQANPHQNCIQGALVPVLAGSADDLRGDQRHSPDVSHFW